MKLPPEFGSGHADIPENVHALSARTLAYHFGERVGCPTVPALVEERGAMEMGKRYLQILTYYQVSLDAIRPLRPDIAQEMERPKARLKNEPLSNFDSAWIPKENKTIIPGPETPLGYTIPRLITSYINDSQTEGTPSDKMARALNLLDDVLENLSQRDAGKDLLLKFAEALVVTGKADALMILRNTISAGKMRQDSFNTYFEEIVNAMPDSAPHLASIYNDLSSEDKAANKIANPAQRLEI